MNLQLRGQLPNFRFDFHQSKARNSLLILLPMGRELEPKAEAILVKHGLLLLVLLV